MTPQDFAMLMAHERRVLDLAYVANQAEHLYRPTSEDDTRLADRLVDMGFLACYGRGQYVPTGPNITHQEGVVR